MVLLLVAGAFIGLGALAVVVGYFATALIHRIMNHVGGKSNGRR